MAVCALAALFAVCLTLARALVQLPADYANSVEALVRKYADNENSILVAVVAGDGDVNNSNAMRVCKSVDPGGQRTVGVLTKVGCLCGWCAGGRDVGGP